MPQPDTVPLILLDFEDDACAPPQRLCFAHPLKVVAADTLAEVRPALESVERAVAQGLYAAGFVAYEAAPAFDRALVVRAPAAPLPLVWFGLFARPLAAPPADASGSYQLSAWQPSVSRATYERQIARVRAAIARGDTYQTNYTLRLRARFAGDDLMLYEHLRRAQRARYGAYLNTGRFRILSASPELFFQRQGTQITTRPMKGTARRGRWLEEDEDERARLSSSVKDRAENVMITDLLRNDLGRVAEFGTVHVPRLCEIEGYGAVLQMTSTVCARVPARTTLADIFAALFPCGSVTGAPKARTMRLISELEDAPRGVYCGAIGVLAPTGACVFNVAIRTLVLDALTGAAEYGVGGGVTWDSTAAGEYAEVLLKAAVLDEARPAFELLETMRLEGGAYHLRARHLARLAASAAYFELPLALAEVRARLDEHARTYPAEVRRVRLLVAHDGAVRLESAPLAPLAPGRRVFALAAEPVSSHDRFLFHKTTNRAVYETRRAAHPEAFDVLLWNEAGELTEFTNGNLVLELDGRRWTPPRAAGLLAGTFRAELLARGEIAERTLTRADLARADRCWFVNSVRGWIEVEAQGLPEYQPERRRRGRGHPCPP
ncbi:MAG TPA: aminodeoxychorismate synthase component I [Pyrinomonadaceae bacterium]|jgi:para-aminobenzoate synthetase/4-amino-4-deoxychorismate lyase